MIQETLPPPITAWLPTSLKEVQQRHWDELDVILFTGDAYVDHPSFGAAVVGRVLESEGLRVAIVAQPNWQDDLRDFKKLGKPNLFFAVTAGNMDSMVNHYTANRRLRSDDAYTAGNKAGFRPDYPTIVYTQALKKFFPDTPIIVGGIEASLRRFTHYDYWKDQLEPSFLHKSGADMLIYGMAEKPLRELVRMMKKGIPLENLHNLYQTAFITSDFSSVPTQKGWQTREIHSHEQCLEDKFKFTDNFRIIETESNKIRAARLVQKIGNKTIVVNPPVVKWSEADADATYELPYTYLPHPKYKKRGAIPAYEMVKFSINIHRGCFGGCTFCTISAHQGKFIISRSEQSILKEVEKVSQLPDFKGYISDLGGPSANMYKMEGKIQDICDNCTRPSCIFPKVCKNLNDDHTALIELYKKVDQIPGIKKSFVGSGLRYDMLVNDNHPSKPEYLEAVMKNHVSGRLKVAPEHSSDKVLKMMRKPSFGMFKKFNEQFEKINTKFKLKQQLIPYFISSHPASEVEDMADLAIRTKNINFRLEQVQDLTPTPLTMAAVIFYSGIDPYSGTEVYTARTKDEKLEQRQFFFWYKPEFRKKIIASLKKRGRQDMIDQLFENDKKPKTQNPNKTKKQHKPK